MASSEYTNTPYCRYFLNQTCHNGAVCRYPHEIKRVSSLDHAHSGPVTDICLVDDLVYTSGNDKKLKTIKYY